MDDSFKDALWKKTERKPITRQFLQAIEYWERVDANAFSQSIKEARAEIAKRDADKRFHVTLKHVGTLADPLQWDGIKATYAAAQHALETAARVRLLKEHGSAAAAAEAEGGTFAEAVSAAVDRTAERKRVLMDYAKAAITAGCVGGEAEFQRLLGLGKLSLVIHALREVEAYQEGDPDMGEG
jgi:hypothetical protein